MKIVINSCFGGFCLSEKAVEVIMNKKGFNCFKYRQTKYSLRDGNDEYVKCESYPKRPFLTTYYCTRDLGDVVNKLPYEAIFNEYGLERNDADLVSTVEELGNQADTCVSRLKVVEIPDDVKWEIGNYDGLESVHERHRSWC